MKTRMHSSRMRTARALTVCPKEILDKKIGDPAEKLETPQKIGAPPPRKIRDPSEKLETPKKLENPPPCGQTHACKLITLPQTSFCGR